MGEEGKYQLETGSKERIKEKRRAGYSKRGKKTFDGPNA